MLQWGHDNEVVEGQNKGIDLLEAIELQWGHDNEVVEGATALSQSRRINCFNGATTMKSWKGFCRCGILGSCL